VPKFFYPGAVSGYELRVLNVKVGVFIFPLLFASLPICAVKIIPLYLTHYVYYLTSNTTRVVQQ
jgi:hypothetical protein